MTSTKRPPAERMAPTVSNGRVGSAGSGSRSLRLRIRITTITSAWKTKAARQLIAVVMRPPMSGPVAAPMPPSPLMMPKASAREGPAEIRSVVRM